ncbi:Flp pilus assembly protein TadB [Lachnospiraceae bacterium KM106-2]|nr:Flp pilus assembly protein TadB [Lachnospiraceae bacterium KM106-2]
MTDYRKYEFTKKELVLNLTISLAITSFLAEIFYRSLIAVILLSPVSVIILKYRKKQLKEKRLWELNLEFREAINCLSSSLASGYSIENSFSRSVQDLRLLYEEDCMIIREFEYIIYQLQTNITIEAALSQFAERTELEDINNFTEVFVTAKRTGGDIIKIIQSTSKNIGDKIDVKRNVITLITSKKLEANIMSIVPIGIILYMWLSMPGFLDPMYHNILGIIVMTIVMIVYMIAYFWGQRLMNIQV